MNDKANTATPHERELPECYHTAAGDIIEITETGYGQYCVDCWDINEKNRWNRKFDKRSDAFVEFERWRYLQAPTDRTPSEPNAEPRDGIAGAIAAQAVQGHADPETVQDYFKRLYPEHYVQIITNINRERGATATAHLLSSKASTLELHCAFIWASSPEGDAFWRQLAQREAK